MTPSALVPAFSSSWATVLSRTPVIRKEKPDHVVLAAAKVGGIHANNTYPAEFIYENLMMEANVVHEAYRAGVKKLLFLGSSCIYPRMAEQPMRSGNSNYE